MTDSINNTINETILCIILQRNFKNMVEYLADNLKDAIRIKYVLILKIYYEN